MPRTDVISRLSPWSVSDTVARLSAVAKAHGLTVFATIDHHDRAGEDRLHLHEATTVLLGDPRSWAPVIAAAPLAAIGFPIAALVWSDCGQTTLSYLAVPKLAARWGLTADAARAAWDIEDIVQVVINR
ncbi:MAG: DUF302 domain-containing protein [Solirubrobacteraceae bacterium]